jgi:hypothetical protein
MNLIKSFSRRIFFWTMAIMSLMALGVIGAAYFGGRFLGHVLPVSVVQEASVHSEQLKTGLDRILPMIDLMKAVYIPAVIGGFFVIALIFWLILRGSVIRCYRKNSLSVPPDSLPAKKKLKDRPLPDSAQEPVITKKDLIESNRRFYLHLLTVLQREGRLMDFFAEDLSLYDDAQIGAAVRGIQDGCKNSLKKHIQPKPVMEQNEGDAITVPADFDPNAIKLTGNVTGEPPFRGTLRHRGWRAGRLELPALTPARDSSIIAPAEVEIG